VLDGALTIGQSVRVRVRRIVIWGTLLFMALATVYAFLPFNMRGATFSGGDATLLVKSESCSGAVLEVASNEKLVVNNGEGGKRTVVSDVCSTAARDRLALSIVVFVLSGVVLAIATIGRRGRRAALLPAAP
jgi:hypothetical protein